MSKNGAGASDKDDGWVVASHRRKPKQQMVQCCKSGCKGACPLNVVYRASQADGVPAKCFECGQKYRLPPGTHKQIDKSGHNALQQEIQRLKSELAAAKTASSAKALANSPTTSEEASLSAEQQAATAELNKARDTLRKLENTPEDMCAFLQRPLAELVAEQKALVQSLDAKRRGLRPVDEQLKQSRSRLTGLQTRHERETKAAAASEKQIAELQIKLADQHAKAAATFCDIEKAKTELAQLNLAAAAEVPGGDAASTEQASQGQTSVVTAQAVKGFFESLPPTVAQHPEGIAAAKQVMGLLEKLHSAAELAGANGAEDGSAQSAQSVQPDDMQLDDDLLDQMAEAATAPAEDGEAAALERKARVAEARDRLKANKGNLEMSLAKVRKVNKKT